MASLDMALFDFKHLERLAKSDSTIHRLDARAKVIVTIVFIISVVSFGKYELTAMLPFFIFPVVMITRSNLPAIYFAKKTIILCPFILVLGIFNPFFDREILVQLGPLDISGGWISFVSLFVRSTLTIGTAFILVGVTGFTAICKALERLGMPQVFAAQLVFLYRYIFVLTEEATRSSRARELRAYGRKGLGLTSLSSLLGHLLLRTWQRAERIHMAMLSRGYTGEFHSCQASRLGLADLFFILGWSTFFILLRLHNVALFLGSRITEMLS